MDRVWQKGGTSISGSPSIGLLQRDLAAVLQHSEDAVTIGGERKVFWRRQAAFDAVNARSQADEPPLSFVNGIQCRRESAAAAKKRGPAPRLQQQMERIQHLPLAQQRFVMQVIDTVLAQQDR
jgi:hypothetical protein